MTQGNIEAFLVVVHAGSISGAAERLYTTQPALSRKLRAREAALGYPLLIWAKGVRGCELTAQGKDFLQLAERWRLLWKETRALRDMEQSAALHVAAIGSVATYLLPEVIRVFWRTAAEDKLALHQQHSYEAYGSVAAGRVDLALISDAMFYKKVETIPAYREPMVWVSRAPQAERVHPARLDAAKEIQLPWNPAFDAWQTYWFGAACLPKIFLDHMPLLEALLQEDTWAIVPHTVARHLQAWLALQVCPLEEGPSDYMHYLLRGESRKKTDRAFFAMLQRGGAHGRAAAIVSLSARRTLCARAGNCLQVATGWDF